MDIIKSEIENTKIPEEMYIDSDSARKAQILNKIITPNSNELMKFSWSVNCPIPYDTANKLITSFTKILEDNGIDPYELQIRGSIGHMDYTDFIVKENKKECKFRYGAIFTVREIDYSTYHWLILSVCANGFIGAIVIEDDFYNAILEMNNHVDEDDFSKNYWFKSGFRTGIIRNAQLGTDGEIYSFSGNRSKDLFMYDTTLSYKTMRKIELYMSNIDKELEV